MAEFRTLVNIPVSENKISYRSKVLFTGSCFTENIGDKLKHYKFNCNVNPFGIIYNPVSVANGLKILLKKKIFTESDLQFYNDLWYSFYHHSKFSGAGKEAVLSQINNSINYSYEFFKKTDFLFITWGTAWVYQLTETGEIVSNCHKLPSKLFKRKLLTVDSVFELYKNIISEIVVFNPKINIVLTVSPVRHFKDGAEENQVSKATLLLASNKLTKEFKQVSYFPSYEIMMDDLRDYRFYDEDMVHPNMVAINYIWEKFSECYFEPETISITSKIAKIVNAKNHRSFFPNTASHKQFVKTQIEKTEALMAKYPFINLQQELDYFKD